jgi:hypothetical protein
VSDPCRLVTTTITANGESRTLVTERIGASVRRWKILLGGNLLMRVLSSIEPDVGGCRGLGGLELRIEEDFDE